MISALISTPVGPLGLEADDDVVIGVQFHAPGPVRTPTSGVLRELAAQLHAYFDGRLREFDLPLDARGTPFQREVWAELQTVRYGTTISYRNLAERIGRPKAVRAVGAANGRNPIPIVIPCHRIVGSDGRLVGFGGGIETKRALLGLERGKLF